MSLKDIKNPTYFELNNQINIPVNGQIPLHKDKEAVTAFLNENVKPNRLFTYHPNTGVKTHESLNADVSSYMDKLEWLIKNDYYEEPFIRAYKPEFIEELRAWLHKQNFTFYSFMAAYKFYKQYALKTNNGEYYLEDPEDRALMNALYQANGDEELAKDLARVVITRRYQPATPTYANNGRKRRGEFASCFPAGTMISTDTGDVPIELIQKGMKVLTHDMTYKTVSETMERIADELVVIYVAGQADPIIATPEHPFLTTVTKAEAFEPHAKANFDDGLTENTFWSEIKDLKVGDFIAVNPNRVINVTDETYLERDGYEFVRVLHVEKGHKANKTRVYNLDVEENHTYVANNAIVHNCFIIQVQDNMSDIGRSITNALQLSRKAGGVGLILGNLRAAGSPIKKMDGLASGVLPVMKLFEDSFSYSNQLGTRPGAGVAYLPIFHADVMEFLSSKKENADEKIRLKTLSLGLTVPDKFYELAKAGSKMAIFDPYFVEKELGQSFTYVDMDKEYEHLVELSKQVDEETGMPKIRVKWIEARALEQAISELQQESGYPYIINISTANKTNPIEGRILGSNLCVTGDTRILTNKGYQKAEDLYDSGENLIVTIDNRTKDDVATDFGVSNVQAIPMHMTNKSAKVYEIKTKEGFTLKATAYHKVYVERFVGYTWHPKTPKYEIELIPLKDLKPGDKLLIQSDSGTYGNDTFEEAAYIMGAVAGDGTFTQSKRKTLSKSVRINNFNNKLSIAEHKLEKVVSEMISDLNPELIKYQSTSNPKFKAIEQRSSATLTMLQSSNLATYLDLNFGFNSDTKCEIPERLWTSDASTIGAYLSGLYQTDSTFHVNEKYKSASIELGTIHEDFAKDIQRLLLTLGVYSRIYTSNRKKSLLPDSNRNPKEYDVKDIHSLRIQDRTSIEKFVKFVTLRDTDIVKFENWQSWLSPKTRNAKHHFTAEISEIVELGFEPVYDTTQPSYHSLIFNGIVTSNCSEILQIQTPSVINEQQEYTTLGQDIVCNLGSTNIINMMSAGESFGNDIIAMTKGLTFISDASDLAFVQTIDNGNSKNHAIGLGAMGLHSFLANNQIQYESKDAVDFTGLYFLLLNYYTIMGSMQIAKERKQAFDNFENSTYATGEYFDKYLTTDYTDGVSDRVMKLFKDIHIPTAEDWAHLKAEVQEHGMFNAYRIALAPNGSISYVNDCSASIAPIVNRIEERQEGQVGKIYYPTFGLSNESIPYFKSAYDQDMRWQIRIYEAATEHTDQGLSMNMYLRSDFEEHPGLYEWKDGGTTALTTRDLTILRHFAWRHGIKSMYYTRQYTADSDSEHGGANECESCMI